jgi:hypothetical protein
LAILGIARVLRDGHGGNAVRVVEQRGPILRNALDLAAFLAFPVGIVVGIALNFWRW